MGSSPGHISGYALSMILDKFPAIFKDQFPSLSKRNGSTVLTKAAGKVL